MLWCFGDSFTYGVKCHVGDEYYHEYKPKKTWPKLLGRHLGMKVKNMGVEGVSNQEILTILCQNLKHIKKGDWVVLGDTSVMRLKTFKNKTWSQVTHPKYSDVVMNYIWEEIIPFEEQWKNWMRDIVESVFESLDGVNCRFWSHEIWDRFETIKQHTNGKIDDLHWSWKGHEEMFEYMKERI